MKISLAVLFSLLFLNIAIAQQQAYNVTGTITDANDKSPLIGVSVILQNSGDTANKTGTATDENGAFTIPNVSPGTYTLSTSYIGYRPYTQTITVTGSDVNVGNINLAIGANTLQNVTVIGMLQRAQQLDDTTQFNADAFKTNPDASAEDLIGKMPGVTQDNSGVKVNGETVREVLVDGKPFFGDDPAAALRNLPAEVVDKIQVFDKQSEQSQFTGFDDGQTSKTINIITRSGKSGGQFGKVYAGYGTDNRYIAGGNINMFKGDQRISILALSNNINQQNFATEDLMGVVGTSSGQNRGSNRGGNGGRGRGSDGGAPSGGGSRGGGGTDAGNFLVGQQGGITQTHSAGINYSNMWGKKVKVSGSYFFNMTDNEINTRLNRQYFPTSDSSLTYTEQSISNNKNQNHRVNMRLEYDIDSFNSIVVTPRLTLQHNTYNRTLNGNSFFADDVIDSRTENTNTADNTGFNFSNNILYRHRFAKRGRTISLNFGTQLSGRNGDGTLYSYNEYAGSDTNILDQQYDLNSGEQTYSGSINYTEPINERGQLMFNYSPSYSKRESTRETFDLNAANQQYDALNTTLSNKFDNTYTTHRGGLSYRYSQQKYNWMVGVNGQHATLEGEQTFPRAFTVDRSFKNILPQAMFTYRPNKNKNLRIMYRSATNPPSITQLQNVVDNTNPLLLKTGNPDLEQSYEHSLTVRYGATDAKTSRSFFAFLNANVINDYIANATFIPTRDTFFRDGLLVNRGSQLTMPVNLDGYYSARSFFTYGLPVSKLKSNLNFNAGLSYSRSPALINNLINYSNAYNLSGGVTVGSNVSEKVDFTVNYTGNYNIVKNTLQAQSDNTYYVQNTSLRFNWLFLDGFVFNTTLNHNLYTGLTQSFNQNFLLWNAGLGYKMLKDKSLEARLNVYDILNQNRSINRAVTETYIEDSYTNVLQRYFMLTLTYTLRNFNAGVGARSNDNSNDMRPDSAPTGQPGGQRGGGRRGME
jgi:uncharacterized membrane protein YgcG